MVENVRIGILGAARIAPLALVKPARSVGNAEVTAVAARDRAKAEQFAQKHGIPRVHASYDDLLADSEIDAVYIPLPNGLHAGWTIRAIEAGKHVLVEKPFASNAAEAGEVAAVADPAAAKSGLVVMEAFHYRYHPLIARMVEIIEKGELGSIERIETRLCVPYPKKGDIRYRLDLAGGATMDTGCYTVHSFRTFAAAASRVGAIPGPGARTGAGPESEPTVLAARAKLSSPRVDRWMQAEMALPGGGTGRITCALFSATLMSTGARVFGTGGSMSAINTTVPHYFHRLRVKTATGSRTENLGRKPTYTYQLEAFTNAVLTGAAILTPPSDSIANMRVIDAIYEASGLGARPRHHTPAPSHTRMSDHP